jgi:hypothetical protein
LPLEADIAAVHDKGAEHQKVDVLRRLEGVTISACMLTIWKGCSFIKDAEQGNASTIDDDFPFVSEVYGAFPMHVALDLPGAPVGMVRVADQHAGGKDRVQIIHFFRFPQEGVTWARATSTSAP